MTTYTRSHLQAIMPNIYLQRSSCLDFTTNSALHKVQRPHYSQVAVTFKNNSAKDGGALYVLHSKVRGIDITVIGNSGSAIAATSNNVSFNGEVYISLNNGELGGGINAVISSLSFTGSTVFKENHASREMVEVCGSNNPQLHFMATHIFIE